MLILTFITILCCTKIEENNCPKDYVRIDYKDSFFCAAKDYYKNNNGMREPLGMRKVHEILDAINYDKFIATLPTYEMVDLIWENSDLRLSPIPLSAGPMMTSDKFALLHHNMIEEQIKDRNYSLISGIKKDIIRQLKQNHVTIYGWHDLQGNPIQPVYSGHTSEYKDYSHGLRIILIPKGVVIDKFLEK